MKNTLYLLVKFLASFIVTYLLRYVEPNASWSTKTVLGICVFLGWSSQDILHYLRKQDGKRERDLQLWKYENELDVILANIRRHYGEMLKDFYGDSDLFKNHFSSRFLELEGMLEAAAERKELFVRDFHFQRTELLLNTFGGDKTSILRYVWIIRRGEPLFDQKWEHYCDQIFKATADGAIKSVRALLVLGDGVTDTEPIVQKVASFYQFTKAHDYRIVDEPTFDAQKQDNRIDDHYVDFGIYGSRYIYLTESYGVVTAGRFCKDKVKIERYSKVFDMIWKSHRAHKLPKASLAKIKLSDLFGLKW